MANFVYTDYKVDSQKKKHDLSADTLKIGLLTSSYTPNQDTDSIWSDISANEVVGTGYTAGGATLASVAVNKDSTNHRMTLTATNPSWATSTITARYAAIYNTSTSPTANKLVCLYDFGANKVSTGGTFTITFDATDKAMNLT